MKFVTSRLLVSLSAMRLASGGTPPSGTVTPPAVWKNSRGDVTKRLSRSSPSPITPSCSPHNIDLYKSDLYNTEPYKTENARLQAICVAELDALIGEKEKLLEDSETLFKTEVDKMQAAYDKMKKYTEDTVNQAKESGPGLMKVVQAVASSGKS